MTGVSGGECLEQRQLHVREHEQVVALRDEQRAAQPGRRDRERLTVDERAPSIGSTPSRDHARSANEMPGTISIGRRRGARLRSRVTVRSATAGFPGTA